MSRRIFVGITLLVFFVICLAPLGALAWDAVHTSEGFSLSAYGQVLTEHRQWVLLGNSLLISFGTALGALILGAGAALALEYCPRFLRGFLGILLCVPFLIPPYVFAVAWIDAMMRLGLLTPQFVAETVISHSFGIPSVIAITTLSYFPIVLIFTRLALRRFDRRMLESARLVADPLQTFFAVRAPLCAPWVFTGVGFVFLLTLTGFSVPALFQVNVYPVEIFTELSAFHEVGRAVAHMLPLLVTGGLVLWAWEAWAHPRQKWLIPPDRFVGRMPAGWKQAGFATGCCLTILALALAVPLTFLAIRAGSVAQLQSAWETARTEIRTSLLLSALAATLLTALGFAMAYSASAGVKGSRVFALSVAPFLITGPLLGTGLIALWNHAGPALVVFETILVLVLACGAKYLYFAYQGEKIALEELHPRPLEAAKVYNAGWVRRATGVAAPLTAPALAAVWGVAFLFSLRELDAAVMVAPPGITPLSIRIHSLMHYGPGSAVASLCLVMVGLLLAAACGAAVLYFGCRRIFHAYH
ncbi:MAG: ABC transporter permease subunit [Candidatus Hydrogenedentota bacterium]